VFLFAAVSTCVINSTSEKVVLTQASGGVTRSSSSGGGEDESRSEGGGNGSQQQSAVPSSPSTRKSFFKKNIEDGMDRCVIMSQLNSNYVIICSVYFETTLLCTSCHKMYCINPNILGGFPFVPAQEIATEKQGLSYSLTAYLSNMYR
jgi:hypothetical protein